MLNGVKIKKIIRYHDDRGFFSEIIKFEEETFCNVKQTSYTETYPNVIKAFHNHMICGAIRLRINKRKKFALAKQTQFWF